MNSRNRRRRDVGWSTLILGLALAISVGSADPLAEGTLKAASQVVEEREAVIKHLNEWLLSMDSIPTDQSKAAAEAMRLLGRLRAVEAVPALKKHWAFYRPVAFHDTPEDTPALRALGEIGLPALPALCDIVAEGDQWGEVPYYPVGPVFLSMGPGELLAGYVDACADKEIDPDRHKRLTLFAASLREEAKRRH